MMSAPQTQASQLFARIDLKAVRCAHSCWAANKWTQISPIVNIAGHTSQLSLAAQTSIPAPLSAKTNPKIWRTAGLLERAISGRSSASGTSVCAKKGLLLMAQT